MVPVGSDLVGGVAQLDSASRGPAGKLTSSTFHPRTLLCIFKRLHFPSFNIPCYLLIVLYLLLIHTSSVNSTGMRTSVCFVC